jgi:hypothetical protein
MDQYQDSLMICSLVLLTLTADSTCFVDGRYTTLTNTIRYASIQTDTDRFYPGLFRRTDLGLVFLSISDFRDDP